MKLKPLGDRLIVKAIEEEETTASGIVLPDTAKEKPQRGKVVAVGPGKLLDNGKRGELSVAVGDEVIYGKYSGQLRAGCYNQGRYAAVYLVCPVLYRGPGRLFRRTRHRYRAGQHDPARVGVAGRAGATPAPL